MPLHTGCSTPFSGLQECEQVLEVLRKQERDLAALVHPEQAYQASSQVWHSAPMLYVSCIYFTASMQSAPRHHTLCTYFTASMQSASLYFVCICFTSTLCNSNSASTKFATCQAVLNSTSSFACLTHGQACIHLTVAVPAIGGLSFLKSLPCMDGL